MGDNSAIEWTDATWNPTVGCSIVSPGCTNCYAMKMAARLEAIDIAHEGEHGAPGPMAHYRGTTMPSKGGAVWTGMVRTAPISVVLAPFRWKRGRRIFVNSMSDIFHEVMPDASIDFLFAVMALNPQHRFQVLTKRADRMRAYMATPERKRTIAARAMDVSEALAAHHGTWKARPSLDHFSDCFAGAGPFRNVWLGVSAEDQSRADARIPDLLATPAAVRFVSAEPLLGAIDFTQLYRGETLTDALDGLSEIGVVDAGDRLVAIDPYYRSHPKLDWIIVGGESGPAARPMHPDWVRSIRDQCQDAAVAFFLKQWGAWSTIYDRERDDPDGRRCFDVDRKNPGPGSRWMNLAGGHGFHGERVVRVNRVGKAAAGRMLDGRVHDDLPVQR